MYRISGKGSIEPRGNKVWRIRHNLGRDQFSGKYRYSPWRTVHGTKTEARRELEDYRRELESGLRFDLGTITFAQYSDAWLTSRANSDTLDRRTIDTNRSTLKRVNEFLGNLKVTDIDHLVINSAIAQMKTRGLGETLVHKMVVMAKSILREAVLDGIILRDPTLRTKTPKAATPNRCSLKDFEAARLLAALEALPLDRNTLAVHIGLSTGMRRGEVLGLSWGDVDLAGQAIYVSHSLDALKTYKKPKSDASQRRISIDSSLVAKLAAWKATQGQMLLKQGIRADKDTPVCSTASGGFCGPAVFYHWFTNFCAANGFGRFVDDDGNELPIQRYDAKGIPVDENGQRYSRTNKKPKIKRHYQGLTFHELRHTHATILVAHKVDIKTVQERMGHAKASITLDFYAHADEERDRQASELFNNVLNAERAVRRIVSF